MLDTATKPVWMTLRGSKNLAEAVLSHFNVREAPVPIRGIASSMGIDVIPHDIQMAGILDARDKSNVRIYVKNTDAEVRKRFTIAHEIGHLLMHPLGVQYRDYITSPYGGPMERQANSFAVDLIMPEWLVRPAFRWVGGELNKLAEYFQVSARSMEIRFKELYG